MAKMKLEKIRDISVGALGSQAYEKQLANAGFQASAISDAVSLIERMKDEHATVFLSFTANMVASGLRGIIAEMCRKKFVDAVVTTAGSIDHDVIKSYAPYYKGTFEADDAELHRRGINRLGNIFIPTAHFALFERKAQKWLREIYAKNKCISPSGLGAYFGSKLGDKNSFLRACSRNRIPVYCPGISDGAIGLQMYFFRQQHRDFCVDVTGDMKQLADSVLNADKTAAIILGGGISKHHVIGANILRDGLDYAVYVTTASEYDGSLSGAMPREAKSWGKLRERAKSVSVHCDASIALPLIAGALRARKVL